MKRKFYAFVAIIALFVLMSAVTLDTKPVTYSVSDTEMSMPDVLLADFAISQDQDKVKSKAQPQTAPVLCFRYIAVCDPCQYYWVTECMTGLYIWCPFCGWRAWALDCVLCEVPCYITQNTIDDTKPIEKFAFVNALK